VRRLLAAGPASPAAFRAALASVPPAERDRWLDQVFEIPELPDDGPQLPRGCVPYLPSSVETVLRTVELAGIQASDVFVDVGSGLGRVTALTHFLTGADAIGLEIQPRLVQASRDLAAQLNAPRVAVLEGDAAQLTAHVVTGTVFFLYCPFSGARLDQALDGLEVIARTHPLRVCTVDLPLPSRWWLAPLASSDNLTVYRSRC